MSDALVDALATSAFHVMAVLTRVGAEHDLSLTQLRVLGVLRDRTPRISDLADFLGLEKSTLTGLVDRAVDRGLLVRTRAPTDARAIHISMTPAGRSLADQIVSDIRRALSPLTSRLPASDRKQLVKLLEQMLSS